MQRALFRPSILCIGLMFILRDLPLEAQDTSEIKRKEFTLSQEVDEILSWFPIETETLIVGQGPFDLLSAKQLAKMSSEDAPPKYSPKQVHQILCHMTAALNLGKGKHATALAGRRVALAIEGSGRFRMVPKGPCAVTLYQGCHLLLFEEDLGRAGDSFMRSVLAAADETETLAGHKVARFTVPVNERDNFMLLIARPRPRMILAATDRDYLSEFFRRMEHRPTEVAFPKSLPHWKQIEPNAGFWAMRRPNGAKSTSGFVCTYTPNEDAQVKLRFLECKASPSLGKTWSLSGFRIDPPIEPTVHQAAGGVAEVYLPLSRPNVLSSFEFMLYFTLGHRVAI